jgi:pre-mRNA-splicing factor CWC26
MPSDLASYLAQNYLVADPKPTSKKRKRKHAAVASGLLITDDDETGWDKQSGSRQVGDLGEDGPATVAGKTSEFRRAKTSNWKTVAGTTGTGPNDDTTAVADAILASAAAENEAARQADDDLPILEGDEEILKMSDGTHAGLQSAAAVSAQFQKRQREEFEEFERLRKHGKEEETVYRDATGRRIDISMQRAEARRAAAAAEEKERRAKEDLKGNVQLEERRRRREQLEEAKIIPLARKADDLEMNRELKEKQRWNDPMAQFMVDKSESSAKGGKKSKRRPIYSGAAPPNRYGIRPGYRWDGVDRSNGFESERFKAINRRERNKALDYSWQMDE